MRSVLVQRWIDWSKTVISDNCSAIPLIDERPDFDLDEVLHSVWRAGDHELHADFVGALLESPADLAVRFAALNAYYHLMEHKRGLEEEGHARRPRQGERGISKEARVLRRISTGRKLRRLADHSLGDHQLLQGGRLRSGIQALRPAAAPFAKLARFLRARPAPFPRRTPTTLG